MIRKYLFVLFVMVSCYGCAELTQVLQTVMLTTPDALTEVEVVGGLKEALITGARNSAQVLSATDGYYGDSSVKILLPEEAQVIVANISKIPGGEKLVEDVVVSINRAAEDAAKSVAPIFVNSITSMSIADAFGILGGTQNAATSYLRSSTYDDLYSLFRPKIEASTRKDLVANISCSDTWNTLTSKWNTLANSIAGKIANLKPVEVDLEDYLTKRALDGMFLKVEDEEAKIRTQVSARVTPLLQRVFGSLDK